MLARMRLLLTFLALTSWGCLPLRVGERVGSESGDGREAPLAKPEAVIEDIAVWK